MSKVSAKFTVFFEDPFWVGVFQRVEDGRLSACKVTFGAEPKDGEVWDFLLQNWRWLAFSPPVAADLEKDVKNPKRAQRMIKRQTQRPGGGTKSQQALQLQREQGKAQRKAAEKGQKRARTERQYQRKQEKRRQKHRGR